MDIAQAILSIHPKAEFVIYNEDYSTIRWDSKDIPKPTIEEIQTAIASYIKQPSLEERLTQLESKLAEK